MPKVRALADISKDLIRLVVFVLTTANKVGSLLQHYIDMGAQELDRLFPDGNQMLQELLRDINPVGCPSLTGFGSHLGRSNLRVDQRARRGKQLT